MKTENSVTSLAVCFTAILIATTSNAALINEFEPNPPGSDPAMVDIELIGVPGESFSGVLTVIDTDGGANGQVNDSASISGTFDTNGLLVASIADLENPSFVAILSSVGPAEGGDVDSDDDGVIDDLAVFGTVFDAIGIIDTLGDATDYATALGGQEFAVANEFELAFRDSVTSEWFGIDFFGAITAFDIDGGEVSTGFTADPTVATFGAVNPAQVPEPSATVLLLSLAVTMSGARLRG